MDEIIIFTDHNQTIKTIDLAIKFENKEILILFLDHDKNNYDKFKRIETNFEKNDVIKFKKGLLVDNAKIAQKNSNIYDLIIGTGTRDCVENKKIDIIIRSESFERKDKTHFRMAGINQVMAKLLQKKEYCFDISQLFSIDKIKILGRMKQNKKVLDKYGVKASCYSFANEALELRPKKERLLFLANL